VYENVGLIFQSLLILKNENMQHLFGFEGFSNVVIFES